MYFRLRYIISNFEFGDAQISVSDPARQINVLISKRTGDETIRPLELNQGVATATCQREIPAKHHDEAVSSGNLSMNTEVVGEVQNDLRDIILHAIRLASWRANSTTTGPNPIQRAVEFSWSLDGTGWKPIDDYLRLRVRLVPSAYWTDEVAEFVRREVLGELDEPLGHELLREAAVNRKKNLRSSLVLAVAAAEVGFKQFASQALPDTDWILEDLQSPPLVTMLKHFPWSKLRVQINGKVPSIPRPMRQEVEEAVRLRNRIVHKGVAKLEPEAVDSVLTLVRDLLYFFDALRGQTWAVNHVSSNARKWFSGA
jgi:hypothetical protein